MEDFPWKKSLPSGKNGSGLVPCPSAMQIGISWRFRKGRLERSLEPKVPTDFFVCYPPQVSLTWNLKISPWKRRFLLETVIFRFHVKLWEGTLPKFNITWNPTKIMEPPSSESPGARLGWFPCLLNFGSSRVSERLVEKFMFG